MSLPERSRPPAAGERPDDRRGRLQDSTPRDRREPTTSLNEIHAVFEKGLHLPDFAVVDLPLAATVANLADLDPVFLLVVGAGSRGKTDSLDSLRDVPEVHALSSLSKATLFSGFRDPKKPTKDHSLLPRLTEKGIRVLMLKDFGTVLAMHRNDRGEVLAQLREIFDGSFVKETGMGQSIAWEGHMGFIAGVTPAIDEHHGVLSILGERFVHLRIPDVDRSETTRTALKWRSADRPLREERRRAVTEFVASLDPNEAPGLLPHVTDRIIELADFTTRARTGVSRNGYSREVASLPELEAPMRLAKQLASMWSALRLIGYPEDRATAMIERLAADSIPPVRRVVLEYMEDAGSTRTATVAQDLDLPTSTATRALEDLGLLGILSRTKEGQAQNSPNTWELRLPLSFSRKVKVDGEEGNIWAGQSTFPPPPPDVSGEHSPQEIPPSGGAHDRSTGCSDCGGLAGHTVSCPRSRFAGVRP